MSCGVELAIKESALTLPWFFFNPGSFRNLPEVADAISRGVPPSSDTGRERGRRVPTAAFASSSWRCHCSGPSMACQALSSGAPKASDDQVLVISQVIWKEASRTVNPVRNMLSFLSWLPLI